MKKGARTNPVTFPLVSSPEHLGLPFPLLSVPGWLANDWHQEGDPTVCGREGRAEADAHPESPLSLPNLPLLT